MTRDAGGTAWIEQAPCGVLLLRPDGTVELSNRLFAGWCGRPVEAMAGLHFSALLTPAGRLFYQTHCLPLLRLQGFANEIAFDLMAPDGTRQPVLVNVTLRPPASPSDAERTTVTAFSATETRRHEKALREARRASDDAAEALSAANQQLARETERLRVTLYSIGDAVVTTDTAGRVLTMNAAAETLTGLAEPAVHGMPFAAGWRTFLSDLRQAPAAPESPGPAPLPTGGPARDPPAGRAGGRERDCPVAACLAGACCVRSPTDVRLERSDGSSRWIVDTASPIFAGDGSLAGAVWVARDTTEQRENAARIAHEETHDPLTGLLNRREFERRVTGQRELDGGGATSEAAAVSAVCVVDLDRFKLINDTAGNAVGDELLRRFTARLRGLVRRSDVLARLGGDEFGLLLPGCSLEQAGQIGRSLCDKVNATPFIVDQQPYALTASVGVAPIAPDGVSEASGDTALACADIACDAAKEAGRNRVVCFRPGDAALVVRRGQMGWIARIRDAIESDRFELFYQPIVPTRAGSDAAPRGELLLRLRDEHGALLAPGAFLPAVERYGQMQAVDRWVLRTALAWMVATPEVGCSINVSGQSLGDPHFLGFALEQLDHAALPGARVCIEITETAAIGDLKAAHRFIDTLRARGVRFALDDFGCGLSSFSYLRTLAVDCLKIDGSFVKDIEHNPMNRAIVESIQHVARVAGLQTVAEWVENDAVLRLVAEIGIDFAQGYGTGRPFPIADWAHWRAAA